MTNQKSSISENDRKINWQENLNSENNINHLLTSIGINDYDFVNVRTQYVIDDNRYGLIVIVKEKETGNLGEIIIDTISGHPTWAQLIDCTFDAGWNCEKRIIIYDDGSRSVNKYDHDFEGNLGISFAVFNNMYDVDTYVIKGSKSTEENTGETIKYQVEVQPDKALKSSAETQPSELDMQEILLWIYDDYFNDGEPHMYFQPELWSKDHKELSLHDINFEIDWDKNAAFMRLEVCNSEEWEWLLVNHYQEIQDMLKGCKVDITKTTDRDYEIIITIIDQPFTDFIYATPDEKRRYIERIGYMERALIGSYDGMMMERDRDREAA